MSTKIQFTGLMTLVWHETERMFRIYSQVFLPPIITTLLYFLIFGTVMGDRIGLIENLPYIEFIMPGLIMIAVITNAYSNVASSLFTMRFQRSIEEILVSPMHNSLILVGYVLGGVIRGLIVAVLVFLVSAFFMQVNYANLPMMLLVVMLVATIFSLAGFINAMLAANFDHVSWIPTFILTPLNYFGCVFYSVNMLPSAFQKITYCNPMFYMVEALRHVMLGTTQVSFLLSITVLIVLLLALVVANMVLLNKGVGLRS
jgi:ABC-2 type transport system permease protein